MRKRAAIILRSTSFAVDRSRDAPVGVRDATTNDAFDALPSARGQNLSAHA
jgi:hypothetical protein